MNVVDGFPNWRDRSQYPAKGESLSPSQWAWEFLRRNPEYKNDYAALRNISDQLERERNSLAVGKKYGLCIFIIDPTTQSSEIPEQIFSRTSSRIQWGKAKVTIPPHHAVVTIDMQRPIDKQLDTIKPQLHDLQAYMKTGRLQHGASPRLVVSKKRKRMEGYSRYLQVLDAADCGNFTNDEIVKYVRPELASNKDPLLTARTVNRYRAIALHLRDGGYRDIAFLD